MSDSILRVRGAAKKRFQIDGTDKYIEINTSDTGILERLEASYMELMSLGDRSIEIKAQELEPNSEESKALFTELNDLDKKLRDILDKIFDSPVADACSGGGRMYDPVDGYFRFEVILSDLMAAVDGDLQSEFAKIAKRRAEHTKKYVKKK